jgi:hypothetical protein
LDADLGFIRAMSGTKVHISRTVLGLLEAEEVVVQDKKTKLWSLRGQAKDAGDD